jgi:hypothetical protein
MLLLINKEVITMKQVTRTVKTYHIYASTVKAINGEIQTTELSRVDVEDITVNEDNALKFVQKKYGKKEQYIIRAIEVDEVTYAVPFDVFMQHAVVLEKGAKDE